MELVIGFFIVLAFAPLIGAAADELIDLFILH